MDTKNLIDSLNSLKEELKEDLEMKKIDFYRIESLIEGKISMIDIILDEIDILENR